MNQDTDITVITGDISGMRLLIPHGEVANTLLDVQSVLKGNLLGYTTLLERPIFVRTQILHPEYRARLTTNCLCSCTEDDNCADEHTEGY